MERTGKLLGVKTNWQDREAYLLDNHLIRLITLTGGGHVAEFRFADSSGFPTMSPLWVPPWKTIEPYRYRSKDHAGVYGTITEGKLLSGIVGHNICLDYFGSPSEEEAAQGLSQHGEAPSARWRKTRLSLTRQGAALTLSVRLPVSGLRFSREICLRAGESVAYFKETVTNERQADHFFHWTQHVTLGPPFLSNQDSRIFIPATRAKTFPHGYDEGKALLASNQEFRWPAAPTPEGRKVDLTRVLLKPGLGFVASALLDPRREIGFVAATNIRERLLIGYCFSRRDFPWVAVWEENRAIAAPPWKGKCQARGLEFGASPVPVSRREAFGLGPIFNVPTLACLPARGQKTIRYLAFLTQLPQNFGELRDIQLSANEIQLVGSRSKDVHRVPASGAIQTGLG